ncbi:MAG: S49 family peptidase [Pirellulaceae bacterium]
MARTFLWIALLAALAGCRGPLSKPFQVNTNVSASVQMPPVPDGGALVEMPVIPGGGERKIALVDVDGMLLNMDMTGLYSLGENPVSLFREKLDRIAVDPCVCAVVVRINSYGGGVTASDIMWRDLAAFKARTGLPVVAVLMDVGTGGAYYLATAADQIVAHPTSVTGGLGVILNLYNLRDQMMQLNIFATPVRGAPNVDMGSPVEAMSEEQLEILQAIADEFQGRLRHIVQQGRPQLRMAAEDFDGRVFTARQALARGLIDNIGYVDDAAELARRLGGCPSARVVVFHRCNDKARTPYAVTPNAPLQGAMFPMNVPGLDRTQMPTFLYVWQPEPMLSKAGGR